MEEDSIRKQIKTHREKIRKMASMVTMNYKNQPSEELRIGEDWTRQAKGVYSIVCSLNGEDCTVLNVIFSEGGYLRPHHHDRKEYVFVASGSIEEVVSGQVIEEGGSIKIGPNQSHGWRSNGAKLTVVFKPPYPRV